MILLTLTLLTFLIILADHFHMRNYIGEIIELGLCIQKKWAEVCLFVFCFCFVKFLFFASQSAEYRGGKRKYIYLRPYNNSISERLIRVETKHSTFSSVIMKSYLKSSVKEFPL